MVRYGQSQLYKLVDVAAVSLPRLHQRGKDTAATNCKGHYYIHEPRRVGKHNLPVFFIGVTQFSDTC